MRKFFSVLVLLAVCGIFNFCSANIMDEPCGKSISVSDIGAKKFLNEMKNSRFQNNFYLNFTDLKYSKDMSKQEHDLKAYTSMFYNEDNIGGTIVLYVNNEEYVQAISFYGYPNNRAGALVCILAMMITFDVIGLDDAEIKTIITNMTTNSDNEGAGKSWCKKTNKMIIATTSPKYSTIFATEW